jgi:hypothetical protein
VKRIYYSSGSVLTGDFIADAVLDLAVLVSSRSASASVDIPVVLPDGSTGQANLLISPVSSLLTVPEAVRTLNSPEWDDEHVGAAVRGVRARIEKLTSTPHARTVREIDHQAYISDFDGY